MKWLELALYLAITGVLLLVCFRLFHPGPRAWVAAVLYWTSLTLGSLLLAFFILLVVFVSTGVWGGA